MILFAMIAVVAAAPTTLPQPVMDSILAYTECAAVHAAQLAQGSDPVEAIADSAVSACTGEERRVLAALVTAFGSDGAEIIGDVRAGARRSALSTVAIRRGTAPNGGVNDAVGRWSACISDSAHAHPRLSPEAATDLALQRCLALESAARSEVVARLGPENGEAAIQTLRNGFRGMIARRRAGGRR